MKKLFLYKKKLNKNAHEILRNIQVISFLNLNKVKDFVSFLSDNLNKNEKTLKLIN